MAVIRALVLAVVVSTPLMLAPDGSEAGVMSFCLHSLTNSAAGCRFREANIRARLVRYPRTHR
jgi:hypothetical protein